MTAGPREDVADLLGRVTAALPGGGERRSGQMQMAEAVARAIAQDRHVVVQAGTGTGKSLAYLVPLALAGRKSVVATATKHLQDQLAGKDLPQLATAVAQHRRFTFAVLKGRANYICRQRLIELSNAPSSDAPDMGASSTALFDVAETEDDEPSSAKPVGSTEAPVDRGRLSDQIRRLVAWTETTDSGERSELSFEPDRRAWAAVSVSARECPGAFRCPSGPDCFAELARARAAAADVVVVNTHLYAAHLAAEGAVLPEHDVVVFDEAHAVEDVMTEGLGLELTAGRIRAAGASARGLLAPDDQALADAVSETAERLDLVLVPLVGSRVLRVGARDDRAARPSRLPPSDDSELRALLELATGRLSAMGSALRRAATDSSERAGDPGDAARRTRAQLVCGHLLDDLAELADLGPDRVAWVEARGPTGRGRSLRAAPVDVGPVLAEKLWPSVTAVLTSATIPPLLAQRLGLPGGSSEPLDVGSPFPYESNALLYCAAHLPDRRTAESEPALHDELAALIEAAEGRTLALFTSWRAMTRAVDALRGRVGFSVLAQGELPKGALLAAFSAEESACLFATMSFWQGVDVPGSTLSLVAIDRLPFPRPDDPLLEARRERAGASAFRLVDLPRAATLLAQGAGRLIRSSEDRGVVAVLDRRLATAGYGAEMRAVLPPMPFTTRRSDALDFLSHIAAERHHPPVSA